MAIFSHENSVILTDDSCSLSANELKELNVETIPYESEVENIKEVMKKLLAEKEFVLFVGPTASLSIMNESVLLAVDFLDEEDKSLKLKDRVKVIDSSCFSGGLGLFVSYFSEYLKVPREENELDALQVFLTNHIAHFFIQPSNKRWNNLIYAPRIGPINFDGGRFRGNRGVYNFIAKKVDNERYNDVEKIWIMFSGESALDLKRKKLSEEEFERRTRSFSSARALARQIKRVVPESKIDLSHKLAENTVAGMPSDVIACFYLSTDIRPDEPNRSRFREDEHLEIELITEVAKRNITEITKIAQNFKSSKPLSEVEF